MAKRRIYEIAKEEGLPSSLVLQRLQRAGVEVRTASSTIDTEWAMHVLYPAKHPKPDFPAEPSPPKKQTAKKAEPEEEEPKPERTKPPPRRPRGTEPKKQQAEPEAAPGPPAAEPVAEPSTPAPELMAEATAEAAPAEPTVTPGDAPEPAPEAEAEAPTDAAPEPEEAPEPEAVEEPAPEPAGEQPAEAPAEVEKAADEAPAAKAEEPVAVTPPVAEPAAAAKDETAKDETAKDETAKTPASTEQQAPAAAAASADKDAKPAAPATPAKGPAGPPARRGDGRQKRGGGPGGGPAGGRRRGGRRRVVIDPQAGRRQGQGRERRGAKPADEDEAKRPEPTESAPLPAVEVPSGAAVKDIAEIMNVSTAQIIKTLMGMGEMATITQSLSDDAIELVAEEIGREVTIVHAEEELEREEEVIDSPEDLKSRAPVVTVMGHVDHGKTSLLDAIRSTEVAAGEAGGITQHIGAYQVHHDDRLLTFLDTPGHEAFTAMRARGARVTDVAVIVVAADDGVMPQTVEAIDHARAADVPFMVAINKIDKEGANPDRVKQELAQHEVQPAEWGGSHEFVDVSAVVGTGIDTLLETVLLVADADAEPKANPKPDASGTIIESRLDAGRGPVTTVLVQRGTIRVGDVVLAGDSYGKVRAMQDHTGSSMKEAGPSEPAEILGLSSVVDAGERFRVVENERTARQMAADRGHRLRTEALANRRPVSLDDLFAQIHEGGLKELNIIIKGDVQGSVGALEDALERTEQSEVRLRVIHTGVGAINESDVMLASASQAIIIGFNVRPRPEATTLAEREGVDVRTYRVIYRAIEDVQNALVGMLEPEIVEDVIGQLEVRATFKASRIGTIAGCYVTEGVVRRSSKVRLLRDGAVVHEGSLGSLKRFQDDVREVTAGFECGVLIADYNDVKEGDQIEAYETREVARTSQASSEEPATAATTSGE